MFEERVRAFFERLPDDWLTKEKRFVIPNGRRRFDGRDVVSNDTFITVSDEGIILPDNVLFRFYDLEKLVKSNRTNNNDSFDTELERVLIELGRIDPSREDKNHEYYNR